MKKGRQRIQQFLDRIYTVISKNDMRILPGHLAFFFIISIIPIVSLLGFLSSFVPVSDQSVLETMQNAFPKEVLDFFVPIATAKMGVHNAVIYIASAFILASNGAYSMIITSNELYKTKPTNWIRKRIKSVFLTIVMISLIMFIIIVPGFGNLIINWISKIDMPQAIMHQINYIYMILKWPFAILFIFFNIKILYTMSPDDKIPSHSVNKGALFTTVLWTVVTSIYSYYATNIANYDKFYGSLSSLLVLMFWMYLLSYIFVIGMALNASLKPKETLPKTESIKDAN